VASFRGKVGIPVTLSIRREPGGPSMALNVTPAAIHPNEMFLRGLQASARVIAAANGVRVVTWERDSMRLGIAAGSRVRRVGSI